MGGGSEPMVGSKAFGWGEGASGWCSGGVWFQCWDAWSDMVPALRALMCGSERPDAGIGLASGAFSGCIATPAGCGCGAGSRSWPSAGLPRELWCKSIMQASDSSLLCAAPPPGCGAIGGPLLFGLLLRLRVGSLVGVWWWE